MGLRKPQLHTNFEVVILSMAEILKGNLQILGSFPSPGPRYEFMMGFGKPELHTKLEVASFSRSRNLKGNPTILGSYPSPLYFWVRFYDGP